MLTEDQRKALSERIRQRDATAAKKAKQEAEEWIAAVKARKKK